MKTPKVSVIVAVYNADLYIRQCLDSIIGQSLKDIEIICVDDGSSDDSLEILKQYEAYDHRVRVISLPYSGQETGAALARNAGLENAVGEYLSILDADDFFEYDMLESTYKCAKDNHTDIVIFDGWRYDHVLKKDYNDFIMVNPKLKEMKSPFSPADAADIIFQLTIGAAWNCIYRREFIINNKLHFQPLQHADDFYFTYTAFTRAEQMMFLNKKLVHYRKGIPTSQSAVKDKYVDSPYQALLAVKKELNNSLFIKSFRNRALDYLLWYLNTLNSSEAYGELYNKLRNTYFSALGIQDLKEEECYSEPNYTQYQAIINQTCVEYLFNSCKCNTVPVSEINAHPFPFDDFKKHSRIALYGAGNIGVSYYIQLISTHFCQVVCWADKRFEQLGAPVASPEELLKCDFDFIIIAIEDQKVAEEVKKSLQKMKIEETKIYWKI